MNPLTRYPMLASLLSPFRRSQQKTCAAVVAALCQAAQASSFAIAGQLSCLTEVQLGSAQRPPLPLPPQSAIQQLAPH